MKRILVALTAAIIVGAPLRAAELPADSPSPAAMRAILAPTGTLRAAFLGANPVQGRIDPATGVVTGPVADLVQELARRLDVPYRFISSPDARTVIEHVQARDADIGFLAYETARAAAADFAGPYALMYNSYVVANGSALRQSADVDRAGVVVGAVKTQSQEIYVSSHLRNARVRIFDGTPSQAELEKLLASGELSAFALNRQRALEADSASPALRALPDSFLEVVQAFVVPKGDTAKRQILDRFAGEMRASGFVKASLEKAGLLGSMGVAQGELP